VFLVAPAAGNPRKRVNLCAIRFIFDVVNAEPFSADFLNDVGKSVVGLRHSDGLANGRRCETEKLSPGHNEMVFLSPYEPVNCGYVCSIRRSVGQTGNHRTRLRVVIGRSGVQLLSPIDKGPRCAVRFECFKPVSAVSDISSEPNLDETAEFLSKERSCK
jgi:hypothetical protein